MRKQSSIFACMITIDKINSEKRSESVVQTVESTFNVLKNSVEPSKLEMKNVLLAGVNPEAMEKMIEKYSVKPPLNLTNDNDFDLYTQGHFNQVLCVALTSYRTNCRIPAPLHWCYRLIPLAYKLAAQAFHAKDLMLISDKLRREARFYEVMSYCSKKKEFIPRSNPNPYREAITMGMVIYMLKATQRVKSDFLFKMGIDCLERVYSENIEWAPSFLPYISKAFSELENFVQTCEHDNYLSNDTSVKQEQMVDLANDSFIPPIDNIRNVFRVPSELNSQEALIISSIVTLMEELGSDGEPIFKFQNQWMAIFRVIVDKNLGASKDDYKGFCDWINRLKPDGFRVKLSYVSLKKINDTIYSKPYKNWVYDCSYNASRKPYDNMVNIVERFTKILENNGIIAVQ